MNILIVGGGIAGMASALYLAKAGHQISVYERDSAQPPDSTQNAFDWDRRGAPQIRHSHAMLARLRNLLREDHPEVLQGMMSAGASEIKLYESMPTDKEGNSVIEESDKEIVFLACRRATLEWVLRKQLSHHNNVIFEAGASVTGLITRQENIPQVIGIELDNNQQALADLVVIADGRRSSLPLWLERANITLRSTQERAGIQYFSRFYKLKDGVDFPTQDLVANDVGYLFYSAFCGDNRYFSLALSANEDDDEMKRALKDPHTYEQIVDQIPELRAWAASGTATTEVYPMGGLINRQHHFVSDNQPIVLGLHAIGDAHVCTNPAYGRGLSLAVWQAKLLTETLQAHPTDLHQQALHFTSQVQQHIIPWYDIAAMMDNARTQQREAMAEQGQANAAPENPMKAVADAANNDPAVWRDFWRCMNLLQSPETLMSAEFLERVMLVSPELATHEDTNHQSDNSEHSVPDRETLLTTLDIS